MSHYVESTAQLVVELFVRDLRTAVDFYLSLGFQLLRESGTFAVVTWEEHQLFLDQRAGLPAPPITPVINVRVMVPDVDRAWQHVNALGARIVAPIADREYRLRDFTIADPDGYGVRFGTRIA